MDSIAQQAKPNCNHIIDPVRAQVVKSSRAATTNRLSES